MQYCLRNQENLCISARDWLLIRPQTVRDSIRDSIQIQIVAADSIRDSIRTKISDSQVPIINITKLTFWPLSDSEAYVRRSWYSVLPVLDTTERCRVNLGILIGCVLMNYYNL